MHATATPEPAPSGVDPAALDALDALAAEVAPEGAGPGAGPEAAPVPDLPTADALRFFLAPLFALLAPAWEVTAGEVDALADAYAPVVDKYWPGGVGVEGGALLVTAAVLAPRLGRPRRRPDPDPAPGPAPPAPAPAGPPPMDEVAPPPSAPPPAPAPDPKRPARRPAKGRT